MSDHPRQLAYRKPLNINDAFIRGRIECVNLIQALKNIEKEKLDFELANKKGPIGKLISSLDNNKVYLYKYRQAIATSSVIISLVFVLTENFHKVRYTILTDPYGTEFVYDRFTGKIKKKINY